MKTQLLIMGWAVLALSCSPKKKAEFILLPPGQTGISFSNTITENDSLNILNEANIYNGGGVAVADFDNDGLTDIYFAGNMVPNKLYLNKGNLQFEDITSAAGVAGEGRWCMGVAAVDINHDGWTDVYVSASFLKDPKHRENLLYINQGLNAEGLPVFHESAAAYGLNDNGYSTQAVFLDYDRDGDLDLYLVTNTLYDERTPIRFRRKLTDGSALNTDRLYRNNGNETFTNVSGPAGILMEGWGHAASVSDFNQDGWPDLYVSNDFVANDILYINNRDGTFTNRIDTYFKHTAWYAMGSDATDINNDGLVDLVSLEMLPENNLRKKTMLSGNEYYNYFNSNRYGYQHQYIRNVLQVNQGAAAGGHPVFSDIAFLADMYQTDWSWNPLVADFDNDGHRDLIITNGLPRDVTDLDYIKFNNGLGYSAGDGTSTLGMTDSLPVVNIQNYALRNNQGLGEGLVFSDSTETWGLDETSFSNGAAYADFDNDGDLDLVISNINKEAFLYENNLTGGKQGNHFVTVNLKGGGKNPQGVGTRLQLFFGNGSLLYYEHYPVRGYLSTVSNTAHFGLGHASMIDSLRVDWPDGSSQLLKDVRADRLLTLERSQAENKVRAVSSLTFRTPDAVLHPVNGRLNIHYKHTERDAVDYNIQPLLPHKLSQFGPGIAVGDVDRNGYDDFYVGGPAGRRGTFFMQQAKGTFTMDSTRIARENISHEDMGVLFFDADQDGDLDLYKVAGSYELAPDSPASQDDLYVNDGEGNFRLTAALPRTTANGSCVRAADFDGDGDLDLFVGGRSVSGAYPTAPESYLLLNNGGNFTDVTNTYCPALKDIGMVTDALWSDFDRDGKVDLIITGEWMPVTFFKNTGKQLVINNESGISDKTGWWNSLASGDFDQDGDIDYVAGNLGLNSNYKGSEGAPMTIVSKDFENNQREELIIFTHEKGDDGITRSYPVHTRDDMIRQSTAIRRKFPTFKSFGRTSMGGIWTEKERLDASTMQATHMASSYIENRGNGKFELRNLPFEAQVAPVFGLVCLDVNGDSNLDILLVGNDYGMDPMSGRHDALNGLCLLGNGEGGFKSLSIAESGFYVKGDGKGLAILKNTRGQEYIIATQNKDSLLVFSRTEGQHAARNIKLRPNDYMAEIFYKDGTSAIREFYYGSGFLSQSSRMLAFTQAVEKIIVTDYSGNRRELDVSRIKRD